MPGICSAQTELQIDLTQQHHVSGSKQHDALLAAAPTEVLTRPPPLRTQQEQHTHTQP